MDVVYLSKAFDTVSHIIPLERLAFIVSMGGLDKKLSRWQGPENVVNGGKSSCPSLVVFSRTLY